MNNLKKIKKEIFDIKTDLDDGKDYSTVCNVYTDYSVSMIKYIESKSKSVLQKLFICISDGIKTNLPSNELIQVRMNEQLKKYIIDKLTVVTHKNDSINEIKIDLTNERKEIQFLFDCVRAYSNLPYDQKTTIFNMWGIYAEYDNMRQSFDKLNVNKLHTLYKQIKLKLDGKESSENIYSSIGKHHDVIRYILYYIREQYNFEDFKWRENQRVGWQTVIDSNFVNGIHSQATGSGKSLIGLKGINEYNKKHPTHNVMWICERKDIPQKLFFQDVVKCGGGLVTGIPHKKNYAFWKHNDIIDMDKFTVIEHIYNKNPCWVQNINVYSGKKPIFLIINRAFMTTRAQKPLRTGTETIRVQYRYQEIVNMPKFVIIDECHSSMANETYKLLLHLKYNRGSKIHGLSATPYRSGKSYTNININIDTDDDIDIKENEKKLIKIFHKPGDPSKLNILSFFNLKDAIEEGIILEPVFHWYYIDQSDSKEGKKKTRQYSEHDISSVLNVFKSIIKKCAYKKGIVWCGTIAIAEEWNRIFSKYKTRYTHLKDMKTYIDHSQTKNGDYDKFYDSKDNCIMFCANKFREGSDIPYLSCCLFLDKVIKRGTIPFIQCIGRVLRRDKENEKKKGHVLDGCVREGNDSKVKTIVSKILGYYEHLYEMTRSEFDFEDAKNGNINDNKYNINMFNQLNNTLDISPEKKTIIIKLRNNKTLNINVTKLQLSSLDWKKIIPKFTAQLKKRILLNDYQEYKALQQYCQDIKIKDKYHYEKDYKWYPNFCVEENGEIKKLDIKTRFPVYFKNWYDFLGIDTSGFIQRLSIWRRECKKRGITNVNEYMELCDMDKRFPTMPDDFYKRFTNFSSEFNVLSSISRR
jgi:superfamily II DNA or RNA helicase